jgi:hypothetical protein
MKEKPERETPEEFEDRTGRPWNDDSAVYMKIGNNEWRIKSCRKAKRDAGYCNIDGVPYVILCSNSDAGIPKMEEGQP